MSLGYGTKNGSYIDENQNLPKTSNIHVEIKSADGFGSDLQPSPPASCSPPPLGFGWGISCC